MYTEYIELLKEKLDEYRFNHSIAVANQAKYLAEKYGCDVEKAYLAGLLHDITKNETKENHLHLFNKFGIMLSPSEEKSPKLWHAISGAAYLKEELGITDTEIISAVRYHTTAKEDMSLLEKIVYIADFTSLDRTYNDIDVVRGLVEESLEKAIIYALKHTINDLTKKSMPIHENIKLCRRNILARAFKQCNNVVDI